MSRSRLLFVTCTTFLLTLPVAGDRPAPQAKNDGTPRQFVGRWTVTFANGVVEKCDVRADGTACESEPKRSADGKAEVKDNALVIRFADDRVERWTAVDKRMVVEHWFPAESYPPGARVSGIADGIRFPASAGAEKGQVLTGRDTADNIEVRLVAAKIDNTRGQFLHAKFAPLRGEKKEIEVRFPGHTLTTHETTIMDIIYSTTGVRQFHRKPHTKNIKDARKDTEWSEASLNVVFSIPKDLRATWNDFSHWYLVSIKVRDKK